MRKVYYLSTCSTSKRIIRDLALEEKNFEFQDIKSSKITATQLDHMAKMAGTYEALFSRIARKYRELNLKEKSLGEDDYRDLILNEYTFLKRPVVLIDDRIFIGSGKANLKELEQALT